MSKLSYSLSLDSSWGHGVWRRSPNHSSRPARGIHLRTGPSRRIQDRLFDVPGHYPERLSQPMQRGNPPPSGLNPDNTIEPPDTGTTPVIAPPGSPAGDRRIGPK
jgi:hypothetical protein